MKISDKIFSAGKYDTEAVFIRAAGDRIEIYRTPRGDGNNLSLVLGAETIVLRYIEPREGTETRFSLLYQTKFQNIEIYRTPRGDGNDRRYTMDMIFEN